MQQQQELYEYLSNGPPDKPAFDAEADAAEAVQQLLQGDLVITTYDVLQQVRQLRIVRFRSALSLIMRMVVVWLRQSARQFLICFATHDAGVRSSRR
jgi:hypothetical protein